MLLLQHKLASTSGKDTCLGDYAGKFLVVYFYPRDCTPGCTREGREFRDAYPDFQRCGADIVGISSDPIDRHIKFKQQEDFPFELLADVDRVICENFGIIKTKKCFPTLF